MHGAGLYLIETFRHSLCVRSAVTRAANQLEHLAVARLPRRLQLGLAARRAAAHERPRRRQVASAHGERERRASLRLWMFADDQRAQGAGGGTARRLVSEVMVVQAERGAPDACGALEERRFWIDDALGAQN